MTTDYDKTIITLNPRIDVIEKYFDFNSKASYLTKQKIPREKHKLDDYKSPEYLETEKWFYDDIIEEILGLLNSYDSKFSDDIVFIANYLQNTSDDYIHDFEEGEDGELLHKLFDDYYKYYGSDKSHTVADKIEDEIKAQLKALGELISFLDKQEDNFNEGLSITIDPGGGNHY